MAKMADCRLRLVNHTFMIGHWLTIDRKDMPEQNKIIVERRVEPDSTKEKLDCSQRDVQFLSVGSKAELTLLWILFDDR